jgi:hypothetical protein
MKITERHFELSVGSKPTQVDLDMVNCLLTGSPFHTDCGWNIERDMPNFVPGKSKNVLAKMEFTKKESDLIWNNDLPWENVE